MYIPEWLSCNFLSNKKGLAFILNARPLMTPRNQVSKRWTIVIWGYSGRDFHLRNLLPPMQTRVALSKLSSCSKEVRDAISDVVLPFEANCRSCESLTRTRFAGFPDLPFVFFSTIESFPKQGTVINQ